MNDRKTETTESCTFVRGINDRMTESPIGLGLSCIPPVMHGGASSTPSRGCCL